MDENTELKNNVRELPTMYAINNIHCAPEPLTFNKRHCDDNLEVINIELKKKIREKLRKCMEQEISAQSTNH